MTNAELAEGVEVDTAIERSMKSYSAQVEHHYGKRYANVEIYDGAFKNALVAGGGIPSSALYEFRQSLRDQINSRSETEELVKQKVGALE